MSFARTSSALAAPGERVGIGDDDVSRSICTSPSSTRLAEQPVHALARAADHRCQIGLRIGPAQADLARLDFGLGFRARRVRRIASRPARSRKCSSSTWPVSRRSSRASPNEQRVAQARDRVEQLAEDRPRQDQRLGRLERGGRGRARRAVEQRQLAEEVARPQRGDDRLLPFRRGQHDLDRAGADDVQRVARVALVQDHFVAPEAAHAQSARQRLQAWSWSARSNSGQLRERRRSAKLASISGGPLPAVVDARHDAGQAAGTSSPDPARDQLQERLRWRRATSLPSVTAVTVAVRGTRDKQADLAEELARAHLPQHLRLSRLCRRSA